MAKANFYLKNPKAKTETPINLKFHYDGNNFKYGIGQSIEPKYWNEQEQIVRKSFIGSPEKNKYIRRVGEEINRVYDDAKANGIVPDSKYLRVKLNERLNRNVIKKATLFTFIDDFITKSKAEEKKSKGTISSYGNTKRHLEKYSKAKGVKLDFKDINMDFYDDFIGYLNSQKFSKNTIGKQITVLKAILNEATSKGINTHLGYKNDKFKTFSEEVDAIYLNENEIAELYEMDLTKYSKLERVRDLFIVGCYTGLRFSDFSQLKDENFETNSKGVFIRKIAQKTKKKILLPVHPRVMAIRNKYEGVSNSLPRALSNQKMNDYLKEIGKLAEFNSKFSRTVTKGGKIVTTRFDKWQLLSTHTARRSFATNLYKSGFPSTYIMILTGHKTEKAFRKYIRVENEEVAEQLMEHWGRNSYLKAV